MELLRDMAKTKKCRSCREPFTPSMPLQVACSPRCAIELVKAKQKLERKRETRKLREKIKSRPDWMREAQAAFNAWIRWRDRDQPCISCGRHHQGQYHAGHYRSVGSTPELRFELMNCHKQCQPCNTHLSGNAINYRINLVQLIGADAVEWLEGPHEAKKYTIEDLIEIRDKYRLMLREAKKCPSS